MSNYTFITVDRTFPNECNRILIARLGSWTAISLALYISISLRSIWAARSITSYILIWLRVSPVHAVLLVVFLTCCDSKLTEKSTFPIRNANSIPCDVISDNLMSFWYHTKRLQKSPHDWKLSIDNTRSCPDMLRRKLVVIGFLVIENKHVPHLWLSGFQGDSIVY